MSAPMTCTCITVVDEYLAQHNTRISLPLMFDGSVGKPMIETQQIETGRGKKKAVSMFASFCPFCGVSFEAGKP